MVKVVRDDGTNPLLQIDPDEFLTFFRQKADEAGFSDRALSAVQITLDLPPDYEVPADRKIHWMGLPPVILMVSNIPNDRFGEHVV